jgi:transcriptional regulator with XRE-family HTH domain
MPRLTRLKDVRLRKALTQQQLAERAGVNRVTIARIERGTDEPFPTTVRRVADALGVEPEDLLEPVPGSASNGAPVDSGSDVALDDRITVVEADEVHRLLRAHPDITSVINEAANQLVRFIPDARLSLELLTDPEYGDEDLLLGAATSLPPLEALAALDRFDETWWIPNVRRARGLFFVNLR